MERRAAELEAELGGLALAGADLAAQVAVVSTALGRAMAIEGPARRGRRRARARRCRRRRRPRPRTSPIDGRSCRERRSLAVARVPSLRARWSSSASHQRRTSSAWRRPASWPSWRSSSIVADARAWPTPADRRAAALPGDGPPWVVLMARQLVAGEPTELEDRERLRERIARLAPARRLRLRGDAGSLELRAVAAATSADPLGLAMAGAGRRAAAPDGRRLAAVPPSRRSTARRAGGTGDPGGRREPAVGRCAWPRGPCRPSGRLSPLGQPA